MKGRTIFLPLIAVATLVIVSSCTPNSGGSGSSNSNNFNSQNNSANNSSNNSNNNALCQEGDMRCTNYSTIERCSGGYWSAVNFCGGEAPFCNPDNPSDGCMACIPNGKVCVGHEIHLCTAGGEIGPVESTCDPARGQTCAQMGTSAACDSPCDRAAANHDYQGCDYWAVSMFNPQLDDAFSNDFGIAVANSNESEVTVIIEKNGAQVVSDTVPANSVKVFKLAYDQAIWRGGVDYDAMDVVGNSDVYTGAAYHVTTTLPVTVYQFNPYDFKTGSSYSYSNDGSLLLPTAVLSTNYIVMSRPNVMMGSSLYGYNSIQGVITVVAAQNGTTVNVRPGGKVEASQNGNAVPALNIGQTYSFNLNAGDVLQLITNGSDLNGSSSCPGQESGPDGTGRTYCDPGDSYDLTGTEIQSNNPVAVWGGHGCDLVPFDKMACDHVEEMMFPLETWGKEFVVSTTHEIESGNIQSTTSVVRVMSGDNGVQVNFDPSSVHSTVTLNRGEYIEFMTTENVHITASGPIMVGQFTVGQNYWTEETSGQGDPAFGLVVPMEQYRTEYAFTAPESFEEMDPQFGASGKNYLNIILRPEADGVDNGLVLDGQSINATATPIGNSGWGVIKMEITGGSHVIKSTNHREFGIMVYGFAPYTSYLYPGGLDLEYINPVD